MPEAGVTGAPICRTLESMGESMGLLQDRKLPIARVCKSSVWIAARLGLSPSVALILLQRGQ